jgi:hypothetical protein
MPDVSRFVGIDVRVFDDDFACLVRLGNPAETPLLDASCQFKGKSASIEVKIQIAAAGDIHFPDSSYPSRLGGQLPGYFDGSAPDFTGQVESDRER